jgi:glycerophosphoryl diester phosphodiesterase
MSDESIDSKTLDLRTLLPDIRALLQQSWRAMAVLTTLIWLTGAILFWPMLSLLLRELAVYKDVIVGNYTMQAWLLTPRGATWLILMGSGHLLSGVVYAAGMFMVLDQAARGQLKSGFHIFVAGMGRLAGLFRLSLLCFLILVPCLLLAAAGPALAYLLLLRGHDINYYLTDHPPEWTITLLLSTIWVLVCLLAFLKVAIKLLFVFPCWLSGSMSARQALRMSWTQTKSLHRRLLRFLLAGVAVGILVAILLEGINFLATYLLLHLVGRSVASAIRILAGHLIIGGIFDTLFFFAATAWASTLCFIAYHKVLAPTPPNNQQPALGRHSFSEGGTNNHQLSPSPPTRGFPWKTTLVILLGLVGSSALVSRWYLRPTSEASKPLVIAHRAGAANAPENTLAALRHTLKKGAADVIEIDTQLTRDHVLVVAHDRDLMKQANDPRVIAETDYADLKRTDIGRGFSNKFKGEHLRPLKDFLKKSDGKRPVIVEFKFAAETDLVDRTVALIRKLDMEDQTLLMSLDLNDVRRAQRLAPDIKVGYFVSVEVGDLTSLDVDVIGLKHGLVERKLIEDLHEHDMLVVAWTVDDPRRIVELVELGVDGIITNDPARCAEVIQRYRALSHEERALLHFGSFWRILRRMDLI